MLLTVLAVLPVFLLSALAPLVRADLGGSRTVLGVAVGAFFGVSAAGSVPGGRLCERRGIPVALRTGTALAAVALLGVGLLGRTWPSLIALLCVGGVANALIQPAANAMLSVTVPRRRRGTAFGIKQSAVPGATLLGGVAVGAVAPLAGWRMVFVVAGLAAGAGVVAVARLHPAVPDRRPRGSGSDTSLRRLAIGAALAVAAANSLGAYLVEHAVADGWSASQAGALLSASSVVGIIARLVWSRTGDRHPATRQLQVVAALMAAGSLGLVALAVDVAAVAAAGALLAFATVWGWNGLFLHAITERWADRPAGATGVTQAGAFAGSVVGPPAFGLVVDTVGWSPAWLLLAVLAVAGGAMVRGAAASPG